MGLAFSEPLEQLCLIVFLVFTVAAGVAQTAHRPRGATNGPRRPAPAKAASTSKRRKHKPPPAALPSERVVKDCAASPPTIAELRETGAQPDGRTLVDGVDLADIVDVDLEPVPEPWQEVEPRRRKRADAA